MVGAIGQAVEAQAVRAWSKSGHFMYSPSSRVQCRSADVISIEVSNGGHGKDGEERVELHSRRE